MQNNLSFIQKLIFLTIFLMVAKSGAQNLKFEHYNDNDGLSHNSVRQIIQDKKGFLWLGTFSGLNRFDGYEFKPYLSTSPDKNKLANDDITVLKLDSNSNELWIGTRKGLTRLELDTQTFTTFFDNKNTPNSLPDEEIRSIHIDKFKRIWVGTKSAGLYIFYAKENRFSKVELEGFEYIKEIFEDKNGNIWVGSYGAASIAKIELSNSGEISEISNYTLTIPNSSAINPYINFIYEDHKSNLFVGTREGLYKFDADTNIFSNLYIENEQLRDNLGPYFISVARAPDGGYWVGTLGGLLVCNQLEDIAKGNFKWYYSELSDNTSLNDNLIYALYFDNSGVLWIGTDDGLDKYDPYENQFKINKDISKYIDYKAPRIRGFTKTYDDKVIVATRNHGLFLYQENTIIPLHNNNSDIASIFSIDGKIIYCGLWNGSVLIYNYLNNTSIVKDVGLKKFPILSFMEDDNNNLVVCSRGDGVLFLNPNTLLPSENRDSILPNSYVNKVIMDADNNLWFATENGLVKYDTKLKSSKHFIQDINSSMGLPHNNVSDVISNNGLIWASTRLGLSVYNETKDSFDKVTKPAEIAGKWVTDMVLDSQGGLWLNINNNSIAKYNSINETANVYNVNSGNRLDIFSSSGFYSFNKSKIFLAGKNGIIYFSPLTIRENKWSPEPVITEFKVQNKGVLPQLKVNGQIPFSSDINYGKNVELSYGNRNFSIQFSTPSFTNENLNKFQYKLEGFDENWIETTSSSRAIQYTNLYAKNYIFKLKASNSGGIWSKISSYNIKVKPTFWFSYKGLALILFILGGLIYFGRRQIRLRLKLKKELLLEKVMRERDENLNNEKLRLFTNISHELRTPLTLILGPVKQLLDQDNANTYAKSKVELIYQNANRLLRLVNQILDFRRAETGELKLKVSKVRISSDTRDIFNSFVELSQTKNINFNLNVEDEIGECWIDTDKYNKILYNLLSNAMKFTKNYGNVDLFLGITKDEKRTLRIEVSDDGIGVPIESQEKIFSRFYQAKNSLENSTGTGIGLSLVKALVKIHKGNISLKSKPNDGSIFIIELPVYKKAYLKDEIFKSLPNITLQEKTAAIKPALYNSTAITKMNQVKINTDIKHRILLIDDNSELRRYVAEYLSAFYKVYEAENGKEGLEVCRKVKPILCVVDIMMPIMDGFKFIEELKEDENISNIAVLLLTALAENENKIKGYKIGVDGYLVKPFDPSLLKTRIDNIIKIRFDIKQRFSEEVETDVISLAHSKIDIELISKIKELVEKNINNSDLTSMFLCDELAMSSSKLYRKIKQLTDLSPNEFISTVRLKKSAMLLKSKNHNVSEVANMIGFNDPYYFSRCFKKQFGYPPSKLIK